MRCLKIIATYLGPRRNANNNFSSNQECINFLKYSLDEIETNIDSGMDMDVLIVNNDDGCKKTINFINSYNNKLIKRGSIKVAHRDNIGGSFGAFSDGYSLYEDKYDYFLFNEDDIVIFKPNYMEEVNNLFLNDKDIGFVGFAPISVIKPNHVGGGFGVAPNHILKNVIKDPETKKLRYVHSTDYPSFERSEMMFTGCISEFGYKIVNHPKFSPLAENYQKHSSQNNNHFVNKENLSKPFLYKVGM